MARPNTGLTTPERIKYLNRRQHLKKKYGLTPEKYTDMFKKQDGVCGICKKEPLKFHLAVDHCHKTGDIRGLLCTKCNVSLGWYEQYTNEVKTWLAVH